MKNLALLFLLLPVKLFALSCTEYEGTVMEFEKDESGHGTVHYFSAPSMLEENELNSITLHASLLDIDENQELEDLVAPLSYKTEAGVATGWFYAPKQWLRIEIYVSYRHADCGPVVVESINI